MGRISACSQIVHRQCIAKCSCILCMVSLSDCSVLSYLPGLNHLSDVKLSSNLIFCRKSSQSMYAV